MICVRQMRIRPTSIRECSVKFLCYPYISHLFNPRVDTIWPYCRLMSFLLSDHELTFTFFCLYCLYDSRLRRKTQEKHNLKNRDTGCDQGLIEKMFSGNKPISDLSLNYHENEMIQLLWGYSSLSPCLSLEVTKWGSPSDEITKIETPCHSRCDTINVPPCSKAASSEHRPKFNNPPPAMVTS